MSMFSPFPTWLIKLIFGTQWTLIELLWNFHGTQTLEIASEVSRGTDNWNSTNFVISMNSLPKMPSFSLSIEFVKCDNGQVDKLLEMSDCSSSNLPVKKEARVLS